jgi:hypothetical protein
MDLNRFLVMRKSSKDEEITHVSFQGGKYNITNKDQSKFLELYYNSIKSNSDLFLIERSGKKYKYFADIDFALDDNVNNDELVKIGDI